MPEKGMGAYKLFDDIVLKNILDLIKKTANLQLPKVQGTMPDKCKKSI
jgi:hypothetical protein